MHDRVRADGGGRESPGGRLRTHPERRLYFRIAEAQGKSVAEMLASTGSAEIVEWAAEFRLRNEDEERAIAAAREENQFA